MVFAKVPPKKKKENDVSSNRHVRKASCVSTEASLLTYPGHVSESPGQGSTSPCSRICSNRLTRTKAVMRILQIKAVRLGEGFKNHSYPCLKKRKYMIWYSYYARITLKGLKIYEVLPTCGKLPLTYYLIK